MIEVKGKSGIVAKVLADSVNETGNRLVTYELTYPRIIHSEILTHKMLCSNSASSRAIPFTKMAEQLTAQPVRFGQANPGMQDKGYEHDALVDGRIIYGPSGEYTECWEAEEAWEEAKKDALFWSEAFYKSKYHKQVYNRLTEPFQMMKTVISGTEWDNFFWLRNHDAADPTLHELAKCMWEAREKSVPQVLKAGEWHLPYVDQVRMSDGAQEFFTVIPNDTLALTLEEAIKVSAARCAAVSFRNEDYGLEKCLEVYAKFVDSDKIHASTFCHQATPMKSHQRVDYCVDGYHSSEYINQVDVPSTWEAGISHVDRDDNLWSAQFKGFIMNRKLIPGENYVK